MIIDGRQIAKDIYETLTKKVADLGRAPVLTVFTCEPSFETQKYLDLKKKKSVEVGIELRVVALGNDVTTNEFVSAIEQHIEDSDGIIVQLPLPTGLDIGKILRSVPATHDVDGLNPDTSNFLSPVVGAIKEILDRNHITLVDKKVVVVGDGRLVGRPVYTWMQTLSQDVHTVTRDTINIEEQTREADIIVSGAGVPGLINAEMIKDGVVLLDAGTSEDGGELRGDARQDCAEKCSLFTPVPGGIGPITIAVLLKNVVHSSTTR